MTDPAALLRALAVPRLTGSAGNAAVRERLKVELTARGLEVEEHRFQASDAGLRRTAFAAELTALASLAFMIGALAGDPVQGLQIAAIPLLALVGVIVVGGRGGNRVWGVNLVAHRPNAPPSVWLTAHYDSKGQRLSMALRLAAVALLGLQVPAAVALAALWSEGERSPWLALFAVPALLGGVLLSRADLRNDSPGAVDNASGVIAALATFDHLPITLPVGVVFTDAEEWGMQGARALVRERSQLFQGAAVINFDGIDDRGRVIALVHRPGAVTRRLVAATRAHRARWLPVLVDGITLARAARECVTVMRGNLVTTLRIHTPADAVERLRLDGVRSVAAAVADAVRST